MRRSNYWVGLIFILVGGVFLLDNLNIFRFDLDIGYIFSHFWPALFLLLPGIAIHSNFFSGANKDAGILVPGGISLTLGIAFQISVLFNAFHIMWPLYIGSVAVGLFELYYFGTRDKALLIPVGILGGLSVIFFTTFSLNQIFNGLLRNLTLPVLLIIIGLLVILKGGFGKKGS